MPAFLNQLHVNDGTVDDLVAEAMMHAGCDGSDDR
jgi:hypothetical protein